MHLSNFMKKNISTLLISFCMFFAMAQSTPWQAYGPVKFPVNTVGQINGMGRSTQLKFHPSNPAIMYSTSASGGLWISRDTGHNWTVTGTDSFANTKLASVCIDYTNDQIIYIGTGDPNYFYNNIGIYKSTNGGVSFSPSNINIGNRMALELLMSPIDNNTLIAATNDGIWKTTDGGATWTQKQTGVFLDMKFKAVPNSSTLFAATGTQFYKSIDMGETWVLVSSGITIYPDLGDGPGSRIAVTAGDTSMVYLLMLNNGGTIFRSTDNGDNFSLMRSVPDTSIVGYDIDNSGQGNYNMAFTVSNVNPNEVYVTTHCIWRSMNGGAFFTKLTHWPFIVHTDMHQSAFSPYFPTHLFNMNDGGIWMSRDSGVSWKSMNDGYETTEFYHAAQSQVKDFMIGGTQDNGGLYATNGNWFTYQGGDVGTVFYIDYLARQNAYQCENGFNRSPLAGGYDSTYLPTIVKGNDVKMLFNSSNDQAAFASKNEIYRTINLGDPAPTWTQLTSMNKRVMDMESNPIDKDIVYFVTSDAKVFRMDYSLSSFYSYGQLSSTPAGTSVYANILAIKSDTSVLYLSCGNRVYRSSNGGFTWVNFSGTLPSINIINLVQDELSNDESVYLATARGVYYRNSSMTDWQKYSKGLPTVANIVDMMTFDDGSINRSLRVAYFGRGTFSVPYNFSKACTPSPGLSVANSGNDILISWTGSVNTTIAYRRNNVVNWTTINAGVSSSYTVTGLSGCEKYEFRIRTNCPTDSSLWSSSVFINTPGYPLPSIWTAQDIGAVGIAGNVCYDDIDQSYAVTASGEDVWNRSDQFYFVHTPITGDIEASCRVTAIGNHYGWAKAGLMIRESLDPDSKHSMVCITPGNGVASQFRLNTGDWTDYSGVGGLSTPIYLKITRTDSIIRSYYSFNGIAWLFIREDTFSMNANAYVGLFSVSHENDYLHTAVIDKVELSNHPNLAIQNINNQSTFDLAVFPNPANDFIQLQISANQLDSYQVIITNLMGEVLRKKELLCSSNQALQTIDIKDLKAGMYQVRVASKNFSQVKKFIKY
jgi:photosystem II stability/assembly factor-like uncharacterized protein/regulation of enolase protein 1 (concanavalin A-like superfamily)